jgi:hypothetical protein
MTGMTGVRFALGMTAARHQRMTALAHVNPDPNVAMHTKSPGLMRLSRTHSSRRIGTDAAEQLPYF